MSVETRIDPVTVANRLRPVLLKLNRDLRREAHVLGVTGGQVSLLVLIKTNPGIGVRELAAREGVSAAAMARALERLERALEHRARDFAVEAAHNHADAASVSACRSLEHDVVVGNAECAYGMLARGACLVSALTLLDRFRDVRLVPRGRLDLRRELAVDALRHADSSSAPSRRSWWWSLWPSLSRFVAR